MGSGTPAARLLATGVCQCQHAGPKRPGIRQCGGLTARPVAGPQGGAGRPPPEFTADSWWARSGRYVGSPHLPAILGDHRQGP